MSIHSIGGVYLQDLQPMVNDKLGGKKVFRLHECSLNVGLMSTMHM